MIKNHTSYLYLLLAGLLICTACRPDRYLQFVEEDGYRWAELPTSWRGTDGFRQLSSSQTNIDFGNFVSSELKEKNRNYLNGSGVTVADINGNGLVDIYFASLDGPNKLYKNEGNFRFRDITEEAGVAHEGFSSTGAVFADVNGNGFPDLLITSLQEGNTLYINDGNGRFNLKENSGLGESIGAKSMALADVTGNGYPDLYITNYNTITARDIYGPAELDPENIIETVDGEIRIRVPFEQYYVVVDADGGPFLNEIGTSDEFYLNRGDGHFERADPSQFFFDENGDPFEELPKDWGLTSSFRDVTGNGLPDLYVANDFWTPDRFWINRGDGTFRLLGTDGIRNYSYSSMGVDFSDINRNGLTDIVVTEMLSLEHEKRMRQFSQIMINLEGRDLYNRNSLYLNRGDTTFAQIAYYAGLEASEWSWATSFMDINLNGYEDLIVVNGFSNDYQDMDTQIAMYEFDSGVTPGTGDVMDYPLLETRNKIFRNNGDLTFTNVSREWGFTEEDITHGMALADLNNNGYLDVIMNRMDREAAIFENRSNKPRIAVRLKGDAPNTSGIGATIKLEGGPVRQSKQIFSGGNYLSGSQYMAFFAANQDNSNHTLTVHWPNGNISTLEGVRANRMYEIDETSSEKPSKGFEPLEGFEEPLFEDVSDRFNHTHHENEYDDFRFTPLLPVQLSRLGPGTARLDLTGNGSDELIITSGRDGQTAIFSLDENGSFNPIEMNGVTAGAPGDQTAVIGWKQDGATKLVIGSANYEQGNPGVPSAFIYTIENGDVIKTEGIPGILSTTGPLAAADYSGNGYPDLFVGGRHKPGQYPVSADSRLFINEGDNFVLDERNSRLLQEAGLVTDALFADITGNGYQDLLISTEWGTLRLFENRNGRYVEISDEAGFSNYKGWWKSIAVGDFTNNGQLDIVALNIGRNSPYQLRDGRPIRMYYDDFNWDGRLNILETYYSEAHNGYVPMRKLHDFSSVPTILQQVSTHAEFASAGIEEIFGQSFNNVPFKEINTLEHMLFINRDGRFEGQPLPQQAQFTSGISALVADFDNDGNEDLFLAQNFSAYAHHIPRQDAGLGLLLKGDGTGNLEPVHHAKSGIRAGIEQRGAALSDFNNNGKTDIVITQNNSQSGVFENRAEQPGIRVQLMGPAGNQNAVGSSVRLLYNGDSQGPRRMILTGSGYGSQNSFTQVLGYHEEPVAIEVSWFDGTATTVNYEAGTMEYQIHY